LSIYNFISVDYCILCYIDGILPGRDDRLLSIEKQILYLLTRISVIGVQELVRIYEGRGYSSQYIRNVLSQLKKDGFVDSPFRSTYKITEHGRLFIQSINQKPMGYRSAWNKSWHVVMTEIPEEHRKLRDRFRNDIKQLGFGPLSKGNYLSPWDFSNQVIELANRYHIKNYITIVSGDIRHNDITPDRAFDIWQLEQVAQVYQDKKDYFHSEYLPMTQLKVSGKKDPLDIFLCFLHLAEIISELSLRDPMLPKELLPVDWEGEKILTEMWDYNLYLSELIPNDSYYYQFTH
jgi:phenylacetic acid degradation operon negative regulatory protein